MDALVSKPLQQECGASRKTAIRVNAKPQSEHAGVRLPACGPAPAPAAPAPHVAARTVGHQAACSHRNSHATSASWRRVLAALDGLRVGQGMVRQLVIEGSVLALQNDETLVFS